MTSAGKSSSTYEQVHTEQTQPNGEHEAYGILHEVFLDTLEDFQKLITNIKEGR